MTRASSSGRLVNCVCSEMRSVAHLLSILLLSLPPSTRARGAQHLSFGRSHTRQCDFLPMGRARPAAAMALLWPGRHLAPAAPTASAPYDTGRQKGSTRARTGSSSDQSPCSSTWLSLERAGAPRDRVTPSPGRRDNSTAALRSRVSTPTWGPASARAAARPTRRGAQYPTHARGLPASVRSLASAARMRSRSRPMLLTMSEKIVSSSAPGTP